MGHAEQSRERVVVGLVNPIRQAGRWGLNEKFDFVGNRGGRRLQAVARAVCRPANERCVGRPER